MTDMIIIPQVHIDPMLNADRSRRYGDDGGDCSSLAMRGIFNSSSAMRRTPSSHDRDSSDGENDSIVFDDDAMGGLSGEGDEASAACEGLASPPPHNDNGESHNDDKNDSSIDAAMDELLGGEEEKEDGDDEAASTTSSSSSSSPPVVAEQEEEESESGSTSISSNNNSKPNSRYGGLVNLSNTCYMASGIQMLASLEDFDECVRREEPPANPNNNVNEAKGDADADSNNSRKLLIRDSFLDVVDRLNKGETVHPTEFKSLLDSKTDLFVGYEQQDAHEFITTLLDSLDEDYKTTSKEEEDDDDEKEECDNNDEMDITIDDDENVSYSSKKARVREPELYDDEGSCSSDDLLGAAAVQTRNNDDANQKEESPNLRLSFSELDLNEISNLIYEQQQQSHQSCCSSYPEQKQDASSHEPSAPRLCKLVGGRMHADNLLRRPYETKPVVETVAEQESSDMDVTRDNNADEEEGATSSNGGEEAGDGSCGAKMNSPVDAYFTTCVRVRLTCDSCKYTRTKQERFSHLTLEIGPDNSGASVEDGLRRYFAPDRRTIKCEKCFGESATQTIEITQLPKALLLHLNRFILDYASDYSRVSYRKNQSVVAFDSKLHLNEDAGGILNEFLAGDCIICPPKCNSSPAIDETNDAQQQRHYSLGSVVNHMGSTVTFGHYTADSYRRVYDDDNNNDGSGCDNHRREWTRFNDCDVTPITEEEAIHESRRTAYLLCYEMEIK